MASPRTTFPDPSAVPTLPELNELLDSVEILESQVADHLGHMKKVLHKMVKAGQWRKEWNRTISPSTKESTPKSELKAKQVDLVTMIQSVRHEMTLRLSELEGNLSTKEETLIARRGQYIAELRRQLSLRSGNSSQPTSVETQLLTGAAYTSNELEKFLREQIDLYDKEVSQYENRKPAVVSKSLKKMIRQELDFVAKSLGNLLQSRKTRAELVENSILFDYSYETPDGHSQGSQGAHGQLLPTLGMTTEELQIVIQFQAMVRLLTKESLTVKWNEIERSEKLGEGAYSVVEQGWCLGRLVAIKLFKSCRTASLQAWMREVTALRACSGNPHAIKLIAVCAESREKLCIITPLYKGGSIHDAIYKWEHKFSTEQALMIAKDVALGMQMVHSQNLIHRDLTPTNILLHPDLKGKSFIADFGIAISMADSSGTVGKGAQIIAKSPRGHPRYKAPEIVTKDPYSEKINIWQYGTLLYVLFSNKRPFESLADREVSARMAGGELPEMSQLPIPIRELLVRCWHLSPKDRPSFKKIVYEITDWTPEGIISATQVKQLTKSRSVGDVLKKATTRYKGHSPQNSLLQV